jgi:Flp pilus assembly protein TadG
VNLRRLVPFLRTRERGQGLVEFGMLTPVFMLILLGLLEFGMIFDHTMVITNATREGARSGAAFAAGNTTTMVCSASVDVDKYIVAAVERVLTDPGSLVVLSRVQSISIYKAAADGTPSGTLSNTWTYSLGNGPLVDGVKIDFIQGTVNWNACTRSNGGATPDSIGVSIAYNYQYTTPIGRFLGGTTGLAITDKSVMALNPTN